MSHRVIDALQKRFVEHLTPADDELAAHYAHVIINEYMAVSMKECGVLGDMIAVLPYSFRGDWAALLLSAIPAWPRDVLAHNRSEGMPHTRSVLWKTIADALFRWPEVDQKFVPILLHKTELTEPEKDALRATLRQAFDRERSVDPALVLASRQFITMESEPIVVKAFLQTLATKKMPEQSLLSALVNDE